MGILDIWLITIGVDSLYQIKTYIDTYKAYADLGFIYNHKRLKFIEKQDCKTENFSIRFLYRFGKFIPIYNLYLSLVRNINYCGSASENIDVFEEYGVIEKMTVQEKEIYNKKSSGLTAIKLRRNLNKKRRKLQMIVFSDGSSIFFDYNDKAIKNGDLLNCIDVVEARGYFENKNNDELKKIVLDCHMSFVQNVENIEVSNVNENDKSISGNNIVCQDVLVSDIDVLEEDNKKKCDCKKRVRKK